VKIAKAQIRAVSALIPIALIALLASCTSSSIGSASGAAAAVTNGGATSSADGKGTEFDLAVRNNADSIPLIDQNGAQTSLGALKGKYLVIAPFLTTCQEICPMVSANFGRLSRAVSKAGLNDKIALVELSVDPATDTPARLLAYQKIFGAEPNWSFYTGRPADVSKVLAALGIAFETRMLTKSEIKSGTPDWQTGKVVNHDVSHQDVVIIIGPDGHEKWLEEGIANTEGRSIPKRLNKYLSSQGQHNLASPDPMGSWAVGDVLQKLSKFGGFKFA